MLPDNHVWYYMLQPIILYEMNHDLVFIPINYASKMCRSKERNDIMHLWLSGKEREEKAVSTVYYAEI